MCLLAVADDEPAGCVALTQLSPGVGEVKRMYVAPSHRGRRLAARLLEGIEAEARSAGMTSLRLEAGTEQPEALAVHRRAGCAEIECYGYFAADPETICFEERLADGPTNGGQGTPA